jgi:hypothetical protein
VANMHTLRAVFGKPIDADWLARRSAESGEMIIRYLRPEANSDGLEGKMT